MCQYVTIHFFCGCVKTRHLIHECDDSVYGLASVLDNLGIRRHAESLHSAIWVEELLCPNHLHFTVAQCQHAWAVFWGPIDPPIAKIFRQTGQIEYPMAQQAVARLLTFAR